MVDCLQPSLLGMRIPGTGYRSHLIELACPLLCRSLLILHSFLPSSLPLSLSAPSLSSHALLFHGPLCCLLLLLLLHPLLPAQLRLRSAHLKSLFLKPSLSLQQMRHWWPTGHIGLADMLVFACQDTLNVEAWFLNWEVFMLWLLLKTWKIWKYFYVTTSWTASFWTEHDPCAHPRGPSRNCPPFRWFSLAYRPFLVIVLLRWLFARS